jgi:hypothetical protein
MREPLDHFSTLPGLQKYLIQEIGLDSLSVERAVAQMHMKGMAHLTLVLRE